MLSHIFDPIYGFLRLLALRSRTRTRPGPSPSPSHPTKEEADEFVNNLMDPALGSVDDYVLKKYKTEQGGGYLIIEDEFGFTRGIDIDLGIRYLSIPMI